MSEPECLKEIVGFPRQLPIIWMGTQSLKIVDHSFQAQVDADNYSTEDENQQDGKDAGILRLARARHLIAAEILLKGVCGSLQERQEV